MDERDEHDDYDDEELEPRWPGWRSLLSGRAGVVAVVLAIVVGLWAFQMVREQQQYDSPANTQTVCIPLSDSSDTAGSTPVAEPTEICVTGHG
jgi:hypothetical protein